MHIWLTYAWLVESLCTKIKLFEWEEITGTAVELGTAHNCSVSDLMVNYGGQVVLQYILELDK